MTYTVSSGTLNSTIPYHTIPLAMQACLFHVNTLGLESAVDGYDGNTALTTLIYLFIMSLYTKYKYNNRTQKK